MSTCQYLSRSSNSCNIKTRAPRCLLLHNKSSCQHDVFFDRHVEGWISIFVRGLHVALIGAFTSILHGSESDLLSCFIDSNVVCQHHARGIKHINLSIPRDSWSTLSAVQSLSNLTDQVLELHCLNDTINSTFRHSALVGSKLRSLAEHTHTSNTFHRS